MLATYCCFSCLSEFFLGIHTRRIAKINSAKLIILGYTKTTLNLRSYNHMVETTILVTRASYLLDQKALGMRLVEEITT